MRILSIDTSAMLGSVALSDGMELIAQEQQEIQRTHSERLFDSIAKLCDSAGWDRRGVEAVAVAIGPGSFTGLRIGLAAAKGIALAAGAKIAGVSSLESLALNARGFEGTVVSLIDARRGELYAAAYEISGDTGLNLIMEECVLPPDALIRRLKRIDGELSLVGDGAISYGERLVRALGARAELAERSRCHPRAINLAVLAHGRLSRGRGDILAGLVPNYVRTSDAEVGFRGKGRK